MPHIRRSCSTVALLAAIMGIAAPAGSSLQPSAQSPAGVSVRLGAGVAKEAVDGRLLLLFAKRDTPEPRFQVSQTSLSSAQVFGIDVDAMKPGDERSFDAAALGYPIESLSGLPPGEYTVQAPGTLIVCVDAADRFIWSSVSFHCA